MVLEAGIIEDIQELVALDRGEDFHDLALLTAYHIELIWGWPMARGSVEHDGMPLRAPHAWNLLPDGSLLDAHHPDGVRHIEVGNAHLGGYRKDWYPWLEQTVLPKP